VAGHPVAKEALQKVSFWPLYTPTLDQYARANRHGLKAVSADNAKPGDGVLFNFDGGVIDHIGMFMRHEGGNVVTCDGNSSAFGSQSNGGMCIVRSRPRSQAVTYFTLV
jgi:cell wall-associated NlpC family hydrolase